jgi:hypothetical protein
MKRKIIYIACFVAFGLALGFFIIWHNARCDTPLYLNLPGYSIGELFWNLWVRFISDATPWIMSPPQVYVFASVLFWGIVGTLLVLFLKPKIIAWIMGAYLVIFGGLTIWYYLD